MEENTKNIVAVGLGEVLFDRDKKSKSKKNKEGTFGGAPANFADHFFKCANAILGEGNADAYVVSAIGAIVPDPDPVKRKLDERGDKVMKELKDRHLKYLMTYRTDLPTGLVDKERDAAGNNTYEIHPAAWDRIVWTPALEELAGRCDVVCFGSLAQREELSRATIRRFLDTMIATGRKTLRVFDVNIRQSFHSTEVLEESIKRCNVLKISDEEAPVVAERLCGYKLFGDPGALCQALLRRHENLELVILTEGSDGSRIFTRDRVSGYVIPKEGRVKPKDTVGAGDSFTAAFCLLYWQGRDIWEAQRTASKVAAYVCTKKSATPPYPKELKTELSA